MLNEIDLKRLGHAIRFVRHRKLWGLAELARRAGVSKGYISHLENAVGGRPNVQHLYSIAVALDTTLDRLVACAVDAPTIDSTTGPAPQLPPGLAELERESSLSERRL